MVPARLKDATTLALLQAGLEALDRADAAAAIIAVEGMTTARDGGVGMAHPHPAVKIEKDARSQFSSIWRMLHLDRDRGRWG